MTTYDNIFMTYLEKQATSQNWENFNSIGNKN